jgi:ABC-type transport system substrate-binding protein
MKQSALNLQPVGTGPFQFSRLVQQDTGYVSRYELARNPAFYRVPAFLDEVHVQFYGTYDDGGIESLTNPIQALREQKVDGLHFVPPELREQVERKHIVLHTAVLPQYVGVFFNQNRNPLLQEPVVREALEVALDKQRLMREATDGDGTIMNGPILPGFPGYSYEEPVPGSIVKANELLDEYYDRKNADEYRADERDARIALRMDQLADTATSTPSSTIRAEIEFLVDQELSSELNETQLFYRVDDEDMLLELALVTVDTEEYRVGATIIAAAWEELGIKTTVTYIDPALFRTDVLQRRSYDALLYGVIVGADPDQYAFWHSDNTQHPGLNLAQYVNREVDTIIEQTQATTDADELDTLYQSFATTLQEDRPAIFLYTPTYTYATTDRIQGVHTERMYVPADRYASITDWYIKTKKVFRP